MMNDFGSLTLCVNLLHGLEYDSSLAYLIRESFVNERTNFIKDFIDKPFKYIPTFPVNITILNEVIKEFKKRLESELSLLEKYELPANPEDYEDDKDDAYDIARDNFYALTDGQYGDYPSRYNEDDEEYY